ncbi:MAG TPA: PQQ-binding-like beta-propeller repeat protein [Azospirillaceae bacterium]|nr:PQQ-binding-like beta-propeller repeat protein [Azospirillaceae bacterium]
MIRKPTRRLKPARLLPATALALLLAGCGTADWFGDNETPPLPGNRVPVLQLSHKVEPDPRVAATPLALPAPARNVSWPQPGGNPDHAMGNLALGDSLKEAWRSDIGAGSSSGQRILARPVVADGRVFTMDADSTVSAIDAASGRLVWGVGLTPDSEDSGAIGGGVSFAEGRVYAATGYGEVVALEPATGKVLWRKKVSGPVRGAPTVTGGRVFVVTIDNQLVALAANDGANLWSHTGILEQAGLLGASSPAADGGIVIAPYTSGELVALRVENGRVAWSDTLASVRRVDALSNLADIRGLPVIDRGVVLAVSHSGRMAAIDERTGARIWDQEIGGVETPWVAGDNVFVITADNEAVALDRKTGRARWVEALPRYNDPKDRSEPVIWAGPVMGGGHLWVVSNRGDLWALDSANGKPVRQSRLPDGSTLAPVIADNTLYVLTDSGTLVAYR